MTLSCLCGQVSVTVERPEYVNECNCTLCSKTGARWGYFHPFVLTAGAVAKFGNTLMGVNMWLADAPDLAGIEVRYPDGQAWSGVGGFDYVREPRIIGQ